MILEIKLSFLMTIDGYEVYIEEAHQELYEQATDDDELTDFGLWIRVLLAEENDMFDEDDDLRELTYTKEERYTNKDGDVSYVEREISTNLFVYEVGQKCGLMDNNCQRITEPLYSNIRAISNNMFKAVLPDYSSIVILNNKGELIQ